MFRLSKDGAKLEVTGVLQSHACDVSCNQNDCRFEPISPEVARLQDTLASLWHSARKW